MLIDSVTSRKYVGKPSAKYFGVASKSDPETILVALSNLD